MSWVTGSTKQLTLIDLCDGSHALTGVAAAVVLCSAAAVSNHGGDLQAKPPAPKDSNTKVRRRLC
jgi:hypothetical protein